MATKNTTLSIIEASEIIEVSPRMIRKVLRANIAKEAQPGRGARWAIKASDIEALRGMIEAYSAKTEAVVDFEATDAE